MKAAILSVALLAACNGQTSEPAANEAASTLSNSPAPAAERPAPGAKAFSVEEETDLYGFKYEWSAEAAAMPQLVERFTSAMGKAKAELISGATEDRDERAKEDFPYHPHETQVSYETAGQSGRLLSLERNVYGFTGGAHGSSGSGSLLWDRKLDREVSIQDLLQPGQSWTGAIRQPFCVLLNREREERREAPVRPDDIFGNCPEHKELTVLLKDTDNNGRFDKIMVIADQYVAGPYVEGSYEIPLPITAKMIGRLKPEYANSFEPRPPVK